MQIVERLILLNHPRFVYRTVLRLAVLSYRFPSAAAVALLQKIFRGRLLSVSLRNCSDRTSLKAMASNRKQPIGWASTARILELSFAGRQLLTINLTEGAEVNAQQFYFSRSLRDMRDALNVFAEHGKTMPLQKGALVFEPGCNAGRYLYYFSDLYGCHIFGADVYAPAIDVALSAAVFDGEKFMVADLVSGRILEAFSDHHFDMVFLSSHLAHVTHLPGGLRNYLIRLVRIAKTVVFIEKYKSEIEEVAAELGFWTTPWRKSILGYLSQEEVAKK